MSAPSRPAAARSAEPLAQPTPLHELQNLLAAAPGRSTAAKPAASINASSPKVDLLLRPAAAAPASDVLLPSAAAAATSSGAAPAASSSAAALSRVCATCQRQYAKYVCPRCNLNTCSLPCYKSHNAACTHVFASSALAEEQVLDAALRQGFGRTRAVLGDEYKAAREARKNTRDIMARVADFHQKDDARMENVMGGRGEDEHDEAEDEERTDEERQTEERLLAALSLLEKFDGSAASSSISNAQLLELQSLLPPALLKDFQRSIVDGRMSAWIARWKPWWRPQLQLESTDDSEHAGSAKAAQEAAKEPDLSPHTWRIPAVQLISSGDDDDVPPSAPALPSTIPAFSSLFPGSPSPLLPMHLAELLYAYVYAISLYNGDEAAEVQGIVAVMAELSLVLTGAARPQQETGAAAAAAASSPAASVPAAPAASPSFLPSPSLLPSLHATVSAVLSTASSSPSLSSSCCWALSRLGDVCQLQTSRNYVLRALGHMQRMVERAKSEAKRGDKKKHAGSTVASGDVAPAAATVSSPAASSSVPYAGMSRKLVFFQSFVSCVLTDVQLRAWNQALYDVWEERWSMHADMHTQQASAKSTTSAPGGAPKASKAAIEIVEDKQ